MYHKKLNVTILVFRHALAYIMIPLIQREVDEFKETVWNTHRIRKQKDTHMPDGKPNHIYYFPEQYDLEECGKAIII